MWISILHFLKQSKEIWWRTISNMPVGLGHLRIDDFIHMDTKYAHEKKKTKSSQFHNWNKSWTKNSMRKLQRTLWLNFFSDHDCGNKLWQRESRTAISHWQLSHLKRVSNHWFFSSQIIHFPRSKKSSWKVLGSGFSIFYKIKIFRS